jgi:hypothetical protein
MMDNMLSFLKKPILFQWLNLAMSAWPRRRGCDGPEPKEERLTSSL